MDRQTERLTARRWRALQRLALDAALVEIAGVFDALGVAYLVLKGPAFAQWLYDDPATRLYGDLDLLVSPESFRDAELGLTNLGFAPERLRLHPHERTEHHDAWRRTRSIPARVELHRTLFALSAPPSLVWERLSGNSRTIELGGAAIAVPSEEVSALLAALHAAQHGVGEPRPMEDLQRAVARTDARVWRQAAELAGEVGALDAFAVGLRLAPAGGELCQRLGLGDHSSRLIRLHAATAPDTAMGIERVLTTRGVSGRLRIVVRELWPSPAFMRAWKPVARRGALGLVAAYLWRPFWLMAKLPTGWRAWRRADGA